MRRSSVFWLVTACAPSGSLVLLISGFAIPTFNIFLMILAVPFALWMWVILRAAGPRAVAAKPSRSRKLLAATAVGHGVLAVTMVVAAVVWFGDFVETRNGETHEQIGALLAWLGALLALVVAAMSLLAVLGSSVLSRRIGRGEY